jgi:hypothetical protein
MTHPFRSLSFFSAGQAVARLIFGFSGRALPQSLLPNPSVKGTGLRPAPYVER